MKDDEDGVDPRFLNGLMFLFLVSFIFLAFVGNKSEAQSYVTSTQQVITLPDGRQVVVLPNNVIRVIPKDGGMTVDKYNFYTGEETHVDQNSHQMCITYVASSGQKIVQCTKPTK